MPINYDIEYPLQRQLQACELACTELRNQRALSQPYLEHLSGCVKGSALTDWSNKPCTCGLDKLKAKL